MNSVSLAHSAPALQSFSNTLTGKIFLAVSASVFVALCAHVTVPLFFTPVPFTFGDLAVLLVGLALGPGVGFSALVLYLAEGATGLPVFSPTGPGGIAQLLGPTGGFLFAYPLAAALAGGLQRTFATFTSRFFSALAASAVASTLIMTCGALWLGMLLHLSPSAAFHMGTLPFLPGQAVKIVTAAAIFSSLQRWRRA